MVSRERVLAAIDRLAVRIDVAMADTNPLCLCVLQGGLPFAGALVRRLAFPLQLDCIHVASYGDATRAGDLEWLALPREPVAQRHVLLLDDVLDSGQTLKALVGWAHEQNAASVTTAVLVDKNVPQRACEPDYRALDCPDRFLFGWGMDYRGYWRNLDAVYALPPGAT